MTSFIASTAADSLSILRALWAIVTYVPIAVLLSPFAVMGAATVGGDMLSAGSWRGAAIELAKAAAKFAVVVVVPTIWVALLHNIVGFK